MSFPSTNGGGGSNGANGGGPIHLNGGAGGNGGVASHLNAFGGGVVNGGGPDLSEAARKLFSLDYHQLYNNGY